MFKTPMREQERNQSTEIRLSKIVSPILTTSQIISDRSLSVRNSTSKRRPIFNNKSLQKQNNIKNDKSTEKKYISEPLEQKPNTNVNKVVFNQFNKQIYGQEDLSHITPPRLHSLQQPFIAGDVGPAVQQPKYMVASNHQLSSVTHSQAIKEMQAIIKALKEKLKNSSSVRQQNSYLKNQNHRLRERLQKLQGLSHRKHQGISLINSFENQQQSTKDINKISKIKFQLAEMLKSHNKSDEQIKKILRIINEQ